MHPTEVATFIDRVVKFENVVNRTEGEHPKGLRCFHVSISPTAPATSVDLGYLLPWFTSSEESHESKERMMLNNRVALFNPMLDYNLVLLALITPCLEDSALTQRLPR